MLNSGEDFYWVGFLLGDGSVGRHPSGTWNLTLSLAEKDRGHVEKFSQWFGGDYSIRETDKGCVSVTVYNQEKIEELMSVGVEKQKTQTLRLPETDHESALIRGYSDADGYIGAPGGFGFNWSIASNSIKALQDAKEMIPADGGEIVTNNSAGTNYLRYGKLCYADEIADFLYPEGHDTVPCLKRKRESAIERAGWAMKKTKDKKLESYA